MSKDFKSHFSFWDWEKNSFETRKNSLRFKLMKKFWTEWLLAFVSDTHFYLIKFGLYWWLR